MAASCGNCQKPLGHWWLLRPILLAIFSVSFLSVLILGIFRLNTALRQGFIAQRLVEDAAGALARNEKSCPNMLCAEGVGRSKNLLTAARARLAGGDFEQARRGAEESLAALSAALRSPRDPYKEAIIAADLSIQSRDLRQALKQLELAIKIQPRGVEIQERLKYMRIMYGPEAVAAAAALNKKRHRKSKP